jgi:hypothetical protein
VIAKARAGLIATALAVAALLGAAPAHASHGQISIIEDDARLVLGSQAGRDRAFADLAVLGADEVRAVVYWNLLAPSPNRRTHPDGFDGANPADYDPLVWDRYDDLVRRTTALGMDVLLSPSSPIPYWASDCAGGGAGSVRRCRPNMTQFKRFVQALATRYSGSYADENQGGGLLPRVTHWSIWNEPNQGGWLQPQYVKINGRTVPQSPVIYRDLVRSAIQGLRAAGHFEDDVYLGETAPLGRSTGPLATRSISPGRFLRYVFCLNDHNNQLTGRLRGPLDCAHFKRIAVHGISHHPYTRGGSKPPTTKGNTDNEITISSASRLEAIVRAAGAHHRISRGLPIFYTEFGFQTDPPDSLFGVPLAKQAAWINQSDFIAYRDPSVASVAQYQIRDESKLSGFQTGLRFTNGAPKPSFDAYRLPIWVFRTGGALHVWGQVRPAADDASEEVQIQNAPAGGQFTTVQVAQTAGSEKGYFDVEVPDLPGTWRLLWTPLDGSPQVVSRVAKVNG